MNILIKLTCLIGLVIAPILGEIYGEGHSNLELETPEAPIEVVAEPEEASAEVLHITK